VSEGIRLGEQIGNAEFLERGYSVLMHIHLSRGDLDAALRASEQAEQATVTLNLPARRVGVIAEWVWLWLARGERDAAARWARARAQALSEVANSIHEREELALAWLLSAEDKPDEALAILERLLAATQEASRGGRVIEVLVLQSLAHQIQGDTAQALASLTEALRLTEPEGYLRIFVDEGASMLTLLAKLHELQRKRPRAVSTNSSPLYVEQLLALLRGEHASREVLPAALAAPSLARQLLDPLTERELEVLHLIAVGLSKREIAARLVLTVGNVNSCPHVYSSLPTSIASVKT
jgi:LuxR family maltose regulon positive regulatory protein